MKTHQVYHHTADDQKEDQFQKIKSYHISKGWGGIGYHRFIERSGVLIMGRPIGERGAHAVNVGGSRDKSGLPYDTINNVAIGYCLAGDFTKEKPTMAQIKTLHKISYEDQIKYGIPDENRFNHRDVSQTLCPGVDLITLIDMEHRNYLRKKKYRAENALRWTNPLRSAMLRRLIDRIKALLSL